MDGPTTSRDNSSSLKVAFATDIAPQHHTEIVALLGLWQALHRSQELQVSRLAGGASNVNLCVRTADQQFALRFCMPDSARWGVSRASAIQAQSDAAGLGLAPVILGSKLPEGHYLAEFVEGTVLTPELLRSRGLIPLVAETLRKLHAGRTTAREFSPFDDMRTFLELGSAEGAVPPDGYEELLARSLRVEALFRNRDVPRAFCHSDLVPQNFILHGDGFKLVDFDYAGTGWVAFELASFACQASLDPAETENFLRAYDPKFSSAQRARVELMRFVAGIREATWAIMAEPILGGQTLPMDGWTYRGYAEENLRQANTVITAGFQQYMREARHVTASATF